LSSLASFSEAREALGRVIISEQVAASETAAMAQWMIGETYFLQKRYDDAIAAYEKTLSYSFPNWQAAALLQSAKCCEQLGRFDDAARRYEQVVSDHAETPFVAEAGTRLAATRERLTATKSKSNQSTR
jgi:tetratricopeptide (TPR) repeat protein